MNRRSFLQSASGTCTVLAFSPALLLLEGCPSKDTVAALVQTLGNSASSIAEVEGNTVLAQKLKTDTTAAVSAIQNWQDGSPAQLAIEAVNLVIDDLDLIPAAGPYEPLIVLALGTAASIIAILNGGQAQPINVIMRSSRSVYLPDPPKTATEYKKRWNAICATHKEWSIGKL
jgi:hypothetical protein